MPALPFSLSWLSRLWRVLAWLALALGLCIGAGWLTLHLWIVPRIADFRPALERLATRTVGVPVQIGALQAESTGWAPSFELRDIRLLDAEGRPALSLPRVVVAISVRSVLHLGLEQLVLDQPELDIRHTADGQWRVAGLALGNNDSEHSDAADWLFSQREVVVRGGTVRWTSERALSGQAQALSLGEVDLVLRNRLHLHELRVDATPPADWGERFVLMGRFRRGLLSTHPGRFEDWSGQVFAHFPQVDVAQLRQQVRLGADLRSGQGRLRLWSDIRQGQWAGGAADLDLRQVRLRLDEQLPEMGFTQLSGRIAGQHDSAGWSVSTERLAFVNEQGLAWPGGNVRVQVGYATGQHPGRTQVQAEQLDLQALRELALGLPLPKAWHQQLGAHRLGGLVRKLRLQWEGTAEAPENLQGQIEAEQLALQAVAGSSADPRGVHGAQLSAQWTAQSGQARVSLGEGGWLAWPGWLPEERLAVQQLQLEGRWQMQGKQLSSLQGKLELRNEDLQGQAQAQWRPTEAGHPGWLDLHAQVSKARATRVHRYLPLSLPAEVRRYVQEAVRSGAVSRLNIRVKGDLDKVPMRHAKDGEFRFAAHLQDVDLAYVPAHLLPAGSKPWPALQGLQGELVFERQGMRLSNASARFGEGRQALVVQGLRADIPDLTQDAKLDVQADLRGPAAQLLRTLQLSPVDAMLTGALSQASASGAVQGRLKLHIPLMHAQDTQLQGSVTLAGNDVQMDPQLPPLERAQGTLQFTERTLQLQGVQVRLLGGNTRLEGGLRSNPPAGEPALQIRAQGQVSAEGLRSARTLAPLDALARQFKGQTSYSASLAWRYGEPELQVRSTLEGLELGLPAPLAKRASASLPLALSTRVAPSGQRDVLQLQLGPLLWAQYERDVSGPQARVLRGHVALGEGSGPSALPEQGVSAWVRLDELPLDAWDSALSNAGDAGEVASSAYLPNRLALQASSLTTGGRTLHSVVAGLTREGAVWRANLDARELSGQAVYTPASRTQSARLFARLARLDLPPSAVSEVEALLETPPSSMPTLDIQIEDLTLRGKRLGRVEIEAINADARSPRLPVNTGAREWLLQKFNITVPEASLRANGRWAAAQEGRARRTEMNFQLDLQDAGALLTRLGTPGALRAGAGRLEGQIAWSGSPLSLHYPSLQGQFQVRMGRGQFLKADPGVAKLLGVLSLQGLPRRLLLDFRDVFFEGFAFDKVQGDVQIQQGIASTQNLQIEGVNAIVKMDGSADIARESQQLRVLILPQLDAGGASVVAGLAINPVVGLTAYLAQWLIKSPLSKAAIQEFTIDGSWSEPRVTRVETAPPTGSDSHRPPP